MLLYKDLRSTFWKAFILKEEEKMEKRLPTGERDVLDLEGFTFKLVKVTLLVTLLNVSLDTTKKSV